MSLYYCPACGQLYKADSAKYTAFCVRCGMPSPKKGVLIRKSSMRHNVGNWKSFLSKSLHALPVEGFAQLCDVMTNSARLA